MEEVECLFNAILNGMTVEIVKQVERVMCHPHDDIRRVVFPSY